MVDFITYNELSRFNSKVSDRRAVLNEARSSTDKDTFLSHSSKDAEYLPWIIWLLEEHGASVYCDLNDDRMPDKPSPQTARIIKRQISRSRRLVVFVTMNSKQSSWVPWELGFGDAKLKHDMVALFPAAPNSDDQIWAQREYLGLYSHIVWGKINGYAKAMWIVYDHQTNSAEPLRRWCER